MVPKLHAKGASFRGCAQYLLHDKGKATSSERVEWVETHNLPVEDPHVAWRLMAACALDAPRLKTEAGIKSTGRKSTNSVLHMSLAWHPDEAERLDRAEMVQAAHGALAALGASDRQAIMVAHNDEKHPHLHLLVNRVSPEDGRMLSLSKEKLKLSAWAESYEKARGQIYCEERVLNNAARARGEFTRAAKEAPRHVFELESDAREASAGDPKGFQALRAAEREKDRLLSRKGFAQTKRHRAQWQDLLASHEARTRRFIRQSEKPSEKPRRMCVSASGPIGASLSAPTGTSWSRLVSESRHYAGGSTTPGALGGTRASPRRSAATRQTPSLQRAESSAR